MKLPAASGGVSIGIRRSQPVFAMVSFDTVRLAIHTCNPPRWTGYSGEDE